MLKIAVILSILVFVVHTLQDKDPAETVTDFKELNGKVQEVAQAAAPHVQTFANEVLIPAINQVKDGPEVHDTFATHTEAHSDLSEMPRKDLPGWAQGKYCYPLPNQNMECFAKPKTHD